MKAIVVCAVMMMAGEAVAEMGKRGTRVVQGQMGGALGKETTESPDGESESRTRVAVVVSGAYFVTDGVSVGGRVAAAYEGRDDMSVKGMGVGAGVGYARAVGERVYLWPQVALNLAWLEIEAGSIEGDLRTVTLEAYAPVYVELSEHLLIGAGPAFDTQLSATVSDGDDREDTSTTTTFGIVGSLAGWF